MLLPMDGDVNFLYYRSDILSQLNASIPTTWDDLMEIAKMAHGMDMNGYTHTPDTHTTHSTRATSHHMTQTQTSHRSSRQHRHTLLASHPRHMIGLVFVIVMVLAIMHFAYLKNKVLNPGI